MKQVRLPDTDLRSSILGFGCASLMARVGRPESLRLLETAYDSGIRHFDVARGYGYGEAERVLGDFLLTKRDKVTVATKFGILPPRRSTGLTVAKTVARQLVALIPKTRWVVRQGAAKLVTSSSGHFTVQDAKSSLDTSLRELRTEYLDILLLHECTPENLESDDVLLEFLEKCIQEGKIRYFGIATDPYSTQQILRSRASLAPVAQFANSVVEKNIERLSPHVSSAVITHSALGGVSSERKDFVGLKRLHKYVSRSADRTAEWSNAVGKDCSSLGVLSGLMLNYAIQANPAGIVLYSSQNERHILANATSVSDGTFSRGQIKRFSDLVTQNLEFIRTVE